MTVFLGLTGSIGMGKSTTAKLFLEEGIPVHDSDAVVHELYRSDAVELIEEAFPGVTVNGSVDRGLLGKQVVGNETAMKRLEQIVHPLVRQKEIEFRDMVRQDGAQLAILDVPLLFETGGDGRVDGIIVVTAPYAVQQERVLDRPGMDEDKFQKILARQTPDEEKRAKADFVIDTSKGIEPARNAVRDIIKSVQGGWARGG